VVLPGSIPPPWAFLADTPHERRRRHRLGSEALQSARLRRSRPGCSPSDREPALAALPGAKAVSAGARRLESFTVRNQQLERRSNTPTRSCNPGVFGRPRRISPQQLMSSTLAAAMGPYFASSVSGSRQASASTPRRCPSTTDRSDSSKGTRQVRCRRERSTTP
jgi:hypothetical protein